MTEPIFSEFVCDPEMGDLIEQFLAGLSETCDQLRRDLESGDLAGVRRAGHQMKGAGAGYGFPLLTKAGASLEAAVDSEGAVTQILQQSVAHFVEACRRATLSSVRQRPNFNADSQP